MSYTYASLPPEKILGINEKNPITAPSNSQVPIYNSTSQTVDWGTVSSATPTDLNIAGQTAGDILYFNGTNWVRLAKPVSGTKYLQGGTTPSYSAITESLILACSDETTALTTGTGKVEFQMPYAFTITEVFATVTTAPTGGTLLTIDINESGTSILSTKLTFDTTEKTTRTATTPVVISDSSLANNSVMTIDIDAIGSTIAGAGLKVYIIGSQS